MFNLKKLSLLILCASIATASNAIPFSMPNAYKLGAGILGAASLVCWTGFSFFLLAKKRLNECDNQVQFIQNQLNADAQFSGDEETTIKGKIIYPKVIAKLTPAFASYRVWLMVKPDPMSNTDHARICRGELTRAKNEVHDLVGGLPAVNNKSRRIIIALQKGCFGLGAITALGAIACYYLGSTKK